MNWISLTISNAKRRLIRTLVTVGGVAVAVASLCSLLAFEPGVAGLALPPFPG